VGLCLICIRVRPLSQGQRKNSHCNTRIIWTYHKITFKFYLLMVSFMSKTNTQKIVTAVMWVYKDVTTQKDGRATDIWPLGAVISHLLVFLLVFFLWDRVSLCSQAGLEVMMFPASDSWVLGLQMCMTSPHIQNSVTKLKGTQMITCSVPISCHSRGTKGPRTDKCINAKWSMWQRCWELQATDRARKAPTLPGRPGWMLPLNQTYF
jgi:hypothetical protein